MSELQVVTIQNGRISKNGNEVFAYSGADFLKQAYQSLNADYPKFYKMDILAQMAFLATEWLKESFSGFADDTIAQLFANSSSSLNTDIKFQESYTTIGAASPSLFVYTLPNIANGEIAIRHKLYGESQFFVLADFEADFYAEQCKMLFDEGYKAVLCGWLEAGASAENAAGLLFFATPENVEHIFKLKKPFIEHE